MSGYILCQVKKSEKPYYIESINRNVYSIEELNYFLYKNLYLLDDTVLNANLCLWLRDELELKKLAAKIYALLEARATVGELILPILKEINYLSLDEFKKLNDKIVKYDGQPEVIRQCFKGDALVGHGKYVDAIKVYQRTLQETRYTNLGKQFMGKIYNNMACAYIRLFQFEEAMECYWSAYENLHSHEALKSYLYAFYMSNPIQAYESKVIELGIDVKMQNEILEEIHEADRSKEKSEVGRMYRRALGVREGGDLVEYKRVVGEILGLLTGEYHRGTGF